MQIGISYDGMETTEFKPYICVEDKDGEEISDNDATSSDFLVFVLD
jgi:predicted transcriptional regulator YdeE